MGICSRRNWLPRCLPRRSEVEYAHVPQFFGAGGPRLAAAGVELAFDLTQHSVIGISDVLKNYFKFRRLFHQLLKLAIERKPDAIIGVDYGGFNLRFGHAIKQYVRKNRSASTPWNPKIIQFVSPQVWASRPGRANLLAADYDLLLSIFPFEKDWYAKRVPKLRVEFVGHPMIGRFTNDDFRLTRPNEAVGADDEAQISRTPHVVSYKSLLLPGSRDDELRRHLPVMLGALKLIREKLPARRAKMVLPDEALKQLADKLSALPSDMEIQIGNLPQALAASGRGHRLDRHGDDGVRVLRCADGDALQNVVEHLPNRQTHRQGEMADDAESAGGRGNFS